MVVLNLSVGQFHITDCAPHQYVGHGCEASVGRAIGVRVEINLHVRMERKQELVFETHSKNIASVVSNYINTALQTDA